MERYIGDIITFQRNDTRSGDTSAIVDSDFLRFNQHAQDKLVSLISMQFNYAFESSIDIDIESGKDSYEVNDYLAYGTRVNRVYYAPTSQETSLRRLKPTPYRPHRLRAGDRPLFYRRVRGAVVVEPKPATTQGFLRIEYQRALDRLDIRRGRINGTPSGTNIVLDTPTAAESALFLENTYLCACDAFGTPLLYNGVIASFSTATITLTGDVEDYLVTGKTLADLDNAYITLGKWTNTHSQLCDEAEGYLVEWVNRKVYSIKSSSQFDDSDEIMQELQAAIVNSYKLPDKETKSFPIYDHESLIPSYE